MSKSNALTNVWNNVKEVDLRPMRQEALQVVKLAIVGREGSGRFTLADAMRNDPARAGQKTQTPIPVLGLEDAGQASGADLIIVMVSGAESGGYDRQAELVRGWAKGGKNVLVFVNTYGVQEEASSLGPWVDWGQRRVIFGDVHDISFLIDEFVPVMINLLGDQLISLARHFPLFRVAAAQILINDASFSNAAYSLSTGLAEIVPVFNIPLNVADMVVLTKTQAFLVYRLGLALGLSLEWQDYVAEFGSVLGGGFLWRQLARSLIGLIPAWGIVPKVAVAYAGTYVVGNVVLQWYLTGRHVSRKQLNSFYTQAFARGKKVAAELVSRRPKPRLSLRPRLPFRRRDRQKALPDPQAQGQTCPACGKESAADAIFCQYCGEPLSSSEETL